MSSSDYLVEPGLSNNIIDLLSTIQDRYKDLKTLLHNCLD